MVCELWVLIYNAVEMKFTIVEWASSLHTQRDIQEKYYILINVPVHGEQTEPNPIFLACISLEL